MSEKHTIKDFVEGMISYNKCFSFETLVQKGFNLDSLVTLYPNQNTETEVQIFVLKSIKAIRIISEVETQSEGILTYQSLYIYEKDKSYFDELEV